MKNKLKLLAALLLLTTVNHLLSTALAQNTVFTYQGQVLANGSAFTGAGEFQFALVTSTNYNHQATATANVGGVYPNYFISSCSLNYGGNGYVTTPAVAISGGGGSGATASASLSGGVVNAVHVLTPGTGYTSTPTVTVAPPPADISYVTFWSNDGTSVNGSEPAASVSVGVTNGLFTVVLGDTTQPNMAAISASLFSQRDLQLRIWFNDGTHGFEVLNPPQSLTPTPYAAFAANAGNAGSANFVAASNIVGTLPSAQLPANVLTNGASGVNLSGAVSGNGGGLTNVTFGLLNGNGYYSWGSFTLATAPGVGALPRSVVALDVNGDGKLDLVSANTGGNTLTVLTNNGSGIFGSNATLTVGSGPVSVIAMDVNGDGWLDLVCANFYTNTLTVLTNNGYGGFGFNATVTVGNNPACVIAVDINGDGKLDLVCADNGDNTLTVLTNNGSGVFGANATLNVGAGPYCVIAADVNGDQKMDLISANSGTDTLTVLTNNGHGVFDFNATLKVDNGPAALCAVDVNGDGKVDLISAGQYGARLLVLTNNGSGVFGSNATITVGNNPSGIIAADVNEDGHPDLICANFTDHTVSVLTNNGSGVFGLSGVFNVGGDPDWVIAADVNGDGHLDLITPNTFSGALAVLLNVPLYNGTFSGLFSGNGSGLTAVPAGSLTGTIADGLLSANVALRMGGNAFSGNQTINSGYLGIGLTSPTYPLEVASNGVPKMTLDSSGNLECSGTVYSHGVALTSDRNLKEHFQLLDGQAMLAKVAALPVTAWNYKEDSRAVQHIGPMAQDFHAAFGLDGADDKHISVVDEGGVALAAIQGLNQKLETEAQAKDAEIQALTARLEKLEQRMTEISGGAK